MPKNIQISSEQNRIRLKSSHFNSPLSTLRLIQSYPSISTEEEFHDLNFLFSCFAPWPVVSGPLLSLPMSPVRRCAAHRAEGRKGGKETSQEALGPWPSVDPQPRVTKHLGSAGPAQPPCGGNMEGGALGRLPLVSCVINIYRTAGRRRRTRRSVFVVYLCVFSGSEIFDLSYVCFCCMCVRDTTTLRAVDMSLWTTSFCVSASVCGRCVFPAGPQCSGRVQCRGLCLQIKLLLWVPVCSSLGKTVKSEEFQICRTRRMVIFTASKYHR